jgi:hypothetical protein
MKVVACLEGGCRELNPTATLAVFKGNPPQVTLSGLWIEDESFTFSLFDLLDELGLEIGLVVQAGSRLRRVERTMGAA